MESKVEPEAGYSTTVNSQIDNQRHLNYFNKIAPGVEENRRRNQLPNRRSSQHKVYSDLSSINTTSVGASGGLSPASLNNFVQGVSGGAGMPGNVVFLQSPSSGPGSGGLISSASSGLQFSSSGVISSQALHMAQQSGQGLQAALGLTGQSPPTLLQYAQSTDGSTLLFPVNLDQGLSGGHGRYGLQQTPPQLVMTTNGGGLGSSGQLLGQMSPESESSNPDDSNKKREIRLLKNREAARECRRKKKEYVRCLENRVAVLETQNQKLIEELHRMKTIHCLDGPVPGPPGSHDIHQTSGPTAVSSSAPQNHVSTPTNNNV